MACGTFAQTLTVALARSPAGSYGLLGHTFLRDDVQSRWFFLQLMLALLPLHTLRYVLPDIGRASRREGS